MSRHKRIFTLPPLTAVLLCGCSRQPETSLSDLKFPNPEPRDVFELQPAVVTNDFQTLRASDEMPATTSRLQGIEEPSVSELLDALLALNTNGKATPEPDIDSLKQVLVDRGYETLWAIRHRLESGEGFPLFEYGEPWEGGEEQRLLELLLALDLPEVELVALNWMQAGPSPGAVAELGRYLGGISPGTHDDSIRMAAEQSILSSADLSNIPGELFQLLGEYGDAGTVNLLVDMPWHRDAYANVALSLIPDGSGLDLIIQDARLFEQGQLTTHGRLAVELLAQWASQDAQAARTLFDLARQDLIPVDLWPNVLAAVAGEQSISLVLPASGLRSIHTIFRPEGNQVLYRVTNSSDELDDAEEFRLATLDELLRFAPKLPGTNGPGPGG